MQYLKVVSLARPDSCSTDYLRSRWEGLRIERRQGCISDDDVVRGTLVVVI